jgi:hypothetical protein
VKEVTHTPHQAKDEKRSTFGPLNQIAAVIRVKHHFDPDLTELATRTA